jgi:hypothetical protein
MTILRANHWLLAATASLGLTTGGCAPGAEEAHNPAPIEGAGGKADSSDEATFLTFEFDGKLSSSSVWNADGEIRDQMLYTIGQLNGDRSVGRLDNLKISNIQQQNVGGRTVVSYHAILPVAWGHPNSVPKTYKVILPYAVDDYDGFTNKYKSSCADSSPHPIDQNSMWYYYRPGNAGCTLADGDVIRADAKVAVSKNITQHKYPEYDKVWEDGTLRVVSVFGKFESGATGADDAGISAYNTFLAAVRASLGDKVVTTPAMLADDPGVSAPDVTFEATLADGKKVVVNALLVDEIAAAGADFYNRYEALSTRADLIAYNGHAGLGQNVRALSQHGKFVSGQYVIVFMNGCDTYAYVDGSLAHARASLNPDDPTGTKYLDFVVNGMPAYFASDSPSTMAIMSALLSYNAPLDYGQIFDNIDRSQVVMVTGEEDNVFQPSTPPPSKWSLDETGTIAKGESKKFTSPTLAAGTYVVQLAGTGDADLYVRKGTDPTASAYDCRPYKDGSNERCEIQLTAPDTLHIMVRGYADSSDFHVTGK